MPLAADPRTQPFARIPAGRCVIVANSAQAWSVAAAEAYAAARGIPAGNILSLSLGTTHTWDPGNNSVFLTISDAIKAHWLAKDARAVLIAPGCPDRVTVRGLIQTNEPFNPTGVGYPPFAHLVMGSPSYREITNDGALTACREVGSGRWLWYYRETIQLPQGQSADSGYEIWQGGFEWQLGVSDNRLDSATSPYIVRDARLIESEYRTGMNYLSPFGTQYWGNSGSRVIPCGRIGWGGWRTASLEVPESASNWDGPLNSSLASAGLTSQPAPILVSLAQVGSSIFQFAAFAKAARDWGYDVEHFYRTTSIPAEVEALCPVANAVWTKTAFEGGSVVGAPYYYLVGNANNLDRPQTQEPFRSALSPVNGATVSEVGPSYGFEWALRSFQSGGAHGNIDITHRTSFEMGGAWVESYSYLRGMSGIEIFGSVATTLCAGDPLHRPFHFDAADELPLLDIPPDGIIIDPPPPPEPAPPILEIRHGMSDRYRERRGKSWRW